jgi:hypothetical protein
MRTFPLSFGIPLPPPFFFLAVGRRDVFDDVVLCPSTRQPVLGALPSYPTRPTRLYPALGHVHK